jgi:mRNA interferase RelE/StbE
MSWRIEIKPSAERQYSKLDRDTRCRIKSALVDLEGCERPFLHPHMRPLSGRLKGDYRLRVGGWRVLITPDGAASVLHVYAIVPRGDAY